MSHPHDDDAKLLADDSVAYQDARRAEERVRETVRRERKVFGVAGLCLAFAIGAAINGMLAATAGTVITPSGVPLSIGALNSAVPGSEAGQTLVWNGTGYQLDTALGDPSLRYYFLEEFETGSCATIGKFAGAATGTSTCTFTSSDATHPGVLAITTGTTATEGVRSATPATQFLGAGTGTSCAKALVKFQNLSTSVQQYVWRFGFNLPISNANSTNAVQATYQFSANGNQHVFSLETIKASAVTRINCDGTGGTTNAPIVAGIWNTVEVCENSGGSAATLKVNNTLCATQSTAANLPLSSTALDVGFQCFNDSGSVPAAQICFMDYVQATLPFGVAR